jgi:thiamine biosynthesis protein ThiS
VVIELNGNIKCREEWGKTAICSGDIIEIVKFLGGG